MVLPIELFCVTLCYSSGVVVCCSSGVVWEYKPKNRWKPFNQKNINLLEKTYQSQLSGTKEGGWVVLENIEVRGQHDHAHTHTYGFGADTQPHLTQFFESSCRWCPGELERSGDDDASAPFLPDQKELPVWDPGGVQAVDAPAQPESTAALAAGNRAGAHLNRNSAHLHN